MKKIYIDSSSSGEEKENQVVNKIKKINYHSYLLNNVLNFKYINNIDEFETNLGLILHNLADRLCRNSAINNIYQNIKAKKLGLNENNYNKILDDIKTAFNKQLDQLFTDYNKENTISDKDYIQLFNFLFNENIKLPQVFILKKAIKITDVKKALIKELQSAEINLEPIFQSPLNIEMTTNNSSEILACSRLTNRANKNKIKYLTIEEANNYSSPTIYKLPNTKLKTFSDTHVIHYKTENVQTEISGLGTYQENIQRILDNKKYKENIVKRIFQVIQNKEISNILELPKGLNNFAEQLTHLLFIVEMQRNNTTLFTAPIFLELIDKDNKYLKVDFFPMSTLTATSQARGIAHYNSSQLPNTYFMDYDVHNINKGNFLLKKEGHILIKWLEEVIGNDRLSNIAQIFNIISTKSIISKKEINLVKLQEIQGLLNYIKKLSDYPTNLLKILEENLYNLILHFGNRSEQYTRLFKEELATKNFNIEVKDLMEITYFEFQQVLPKLDGFLAKIQTNLEKEIKKILPEILQILCTKVKEWYDIDLPEYITEEKPVDNEVLRDITLKFNQTTSPSSSRKRLKISLSQKKDL